MASCHTNLHGTPNPRVKPAPAHHSDRAAGPLGAGIVSDRIIIDPFFRKLEIFRPAALEEGAGCPAANPIGRPADSSAVRRAELQN